MFGCKKGQGLVEYALLLAGVALVAAAAVVIFGSKTSDMISAMATILPGAHNVDNQPIISGQIIETVNQTNSNGESGIQLDATTIEANSGTARLGNNVLGTDPAGQGFGGLVLSY
jgi:Flp pilus assembly pilin Flp